MEEENIEGKTEEKIEDTDYAILRTISSIDVPNFKDIEKEIREVAKILQIRVIIVEKHIYRLNKSGFVKFDKYCTLTQKGKDAIDKFGKDNDGHVSIDNFITTNMENEKKRVLKTRKIIDKALIIAIIIIFVYIIYIGIGK